MIIGVGLDLVEMSRIESVFVRYGLTFAERVLHQDEIFAGPISLGESRSAGDAVRYLASSFAAKEAAVKALGTGFAQGITMHDVRIKRAPSGKPSLVLMGRAKEIADSLNVSSAFLSITHERNMAAAVVVLEG